MRNKKLKKLPREGGVFYWYKNMTKNEIDFDPSWDTVCTGDLHRLLDPDAYSGKIDTRRPEDVIKPLMQSIVHAFISEAAWLDESIK